MVIEVGDGKKGLPDGTVEDVKVLHIQTQEPGPAVDMNIVMPHDQAKAIAAALDGRQVMTAKPEDMPKGQPGNGGIITP